MSALVQNALILSMILGFALKEYTSRRYRATVRANANDTKLELLMFVSLVAVASQSRVAGRPAVWRRGLEGPDVLSAVALHSRAQRPASRRPSL
jgi:hypothetical protein